MISFCIIGKNEEAVIDKCLSALTPYGCEIVFVDTGSTDKTREIAMGYTDKVYDFPWINDFAAARNFSISKAGCDFILPVDCDEVITDFDIEETKRLIKLYPERVGRLLRINEFTRENENFLSNERVSRLFCKKLYHYECAIHEQLVRNDGGIIQYYSIPLTMSHGGYDGSLEMRRAKTTRNRVLLLEELKKNPQDTYILYQIGKTFYMEKKYEDALYYFDRVMELDVDPKLEYVQDCVEGYGYCLIETKQYERALGLLGVYEEFSSSSDFVFLMGLIYMNNGMLDEAVAEFTKATEKTIVRVQGTDSFRANYNIGVIYECVGELEQARSYYEKCGAFPPALERLKEI